MGLLGTALWLWSAVASAGGCAEPLSVGGLGERLDSVDEAFTAGDADAFVSGVDYLALSLACLDGVPSAADISRLHRVFGLVLWIRDDEASARAALAAARQVDPGMALPAALVPENHPFRELWDEAPKHGDTLLVGEPIDGRVRFDGVVSVERPASAATLFQYEVDGVVANSRWALPADVLPDYPAKPIPLPKASLATRELALGAASGGTAAAALGMLVGAAVTRRSFEEEFGAPTTGDDGSFSEGDVNRATSLQERNNRLVIGAAGAGVVAVGLGVAVVVF